MTSAAQERVAPGMLARRAVLHAEQARAVPGRDLVAGSVLPTGVVLEVTHDAEDQVVRLEMPGADIHYVDYDETVTVLATVTREVLDGISRGTFVARAETTARPRLVPVPDAPEDDAPEDPSPAVEQAPVPAAQPSARTGKQNRGPLGRYDEGVRHYLDDCPVHGRTTHALHRGGTRRDGTVRYNRRCLECHAEYNLRLQADQRRDR